MFSKGGTGAGDANSPGQPWGVYDEMAAIPSRLSKSATTALILSPVGLILISVVRLLIISNFNTSTALAIASSGGYVDTLLGTVIPLVPVLLPYLALILLLFNRVILGTLSLLAVAFAVPLSTSRHVVAKIAQQYWHDAVARHHLAILILLASFALLLAVLLLVELVFASTGMFMRSLATVICLALLPFVARIYPFPFSRQFYIQTLHQPWLPAEEITMKSGSTLIGYSLGADGDWAVILSEANRTVSYYPAANIIGRQVCRIGGAPAQPPLVSLFGHGTTVTAVTPTCPGPSSLAAVR